MAALALTVLVVPQSLAYALLAGFPPIAGLVASVLPVIVYSLLGRSSVLAVGPVALTSLMTASSLETLAPVGSVLYIQYGMWLALFSGVTLLLLGLFRFGFLSRLLSFPVVSGFTTASALLIVSNQWENLVGGAGRVHWPTTLLSLGCLLALWLIRRVLSQSLVGSLAPVFLLGLATLLCALADWKSYGIATLNDVHLVLTWTAWNLPSWPVLKSLFASAVMIALMSMIASIAVTKSLGRERGEIVDNNMELRALGMANLASAVSGTFPVAGGFSRSAVYVQTGARSPLAGLVSGLLMIPVLFFLTPVFKLMPIAVLSATIVMAAFSLVDIKTLHHSWRYDQADAIAWVATALAVFFLGFEPGIMTGVLFSLGAFLWRASQPHVAVLGRVPGTQGFRNVKRHAVETRPDMLIIRVDESLFFGNIEQVSDAIHTHLRQHRVTRLVLVMSAVNAIDETALEGLSELARTIKTSGVTLELAEVKGPVQDRLLRVHALADIKIWFTLYEAYQSGSDAPTPPN